jgi:hypothetical protein
MECGCPQGHTEGLEQGCTLTIWLPGNPDTGETDTEPSTAEKPTIGSTAITIAPLVRRTSIIFARSKSTPAGLPTNLTGPGCFAHNSRTGQSALTGP